MKVLNHNFLWIFLFLSLQPTTVFAGAQFGAPTGSILPQGGGASSSPSIGQVSSCREYFEAGMEAHGTLCQQYWFGSNCGSNCASSPRGISSTIADRGVAPAGVRFGN